MKHFDPVFIADENKLIVLVLVPNACYLKKADYAGVPDDVATPTDGQLHHTLVLEDARIGSSVLPGDVSFSAVCPLVQDFTHVFELDYHADPNGKDLYVYVAEVEADGTRKKRKKRKVERKIDSAG